MLKYIGDFNSLRNYGFEKNLYRQMYCKVIESDEFHECEIRIKRNFEIEIYNEQHEEARWLHNLDVLYDLIKDGLVIKVAEE